MDNEKDAKIIPFPGCKIENWSIYQVHVKQLFTQIIKSDTIPLSLYLVGEVEITAGDKKVTKKIDVVVPIDIDGLEEN